MYRKLIKYEMFLYGLIASNVVFSYWRIFGLYLSNGGLYRTPYTIRNVYGFGNNYVKGRLFILKNFLSYCCFTIEYVATNWNLFVFLSLFYGQFVLVSLYLKTFEPLKQFHFLKTCHIVPEIDAKYILHRLQARF